MPDTSERDDVVLSPLVADVITAQFEMTRQVTDRLVDSLQHQLSEERAVNAAVAWRIRELCSKPWVPNPMDVLNALTPTQELIDRFKERPGE